MSATKKPPIRVFYSTHTKRFYATRAYKISPEGLVSFTGEKFDVTGEIGDAILNNGVTFNRTAADKKLDEP